jgi:Mg-chelatase subunit ChlD
MIAAPFSGQFLTLCTLACLVVAAASVGTPLSAVTGLVRRLLPPRRRVLRGTHRHRCLSSAKPRNAVLVVDASGSMHETDWLPSRLEAAKRAAKAYAEKLQRQEPQARVGVAAYGDHASVVCPLTPVAKLSVIARAIDNITTSGLTNITAGLEAARELVRKAEGPRQIVLLSDGGHNQGPGPDSVAARLRAQALIDCVGIGQRSGVDERLLQSIASSNPDGSKRYRWIGDPEELVKHFRDLAGRIARS